MNTLLIKATRDDKPKGIVYLRREKGVLPYDIIAAVYEDKTIVFEPGHELSEVEVEDILAISKTFNLVYNSLRE